MENFKNYLFDAFLGIWVTVPAVIIFLLVSLICPDLICGRWFAIFWIIPMVAAAAAWILFWVKFFDYIKKYW